MAALEFGSAGDALVGRLTEGRPVATSKHIESRLDVMLGKPVIRGTRIPVELLVRKLREGASDEELLDAYPRLTREDLRAMIRHAATPSKGD